MMEIETKQLADLIPAEYNPRKDLQPGDPEYEKLRKSIETYGYVEPIIWNKRTERVIGGHQRLKVLMELGVTEEKVVIVDFEEPDEKALNIALNKISGEWDMPKLKDLLEEIDNGIYDVTLTGFDSEEIERLMTAISTELEDIDSSPEPTLGSLFLSIDDVKVPLTEEEKDALLKKLESYVNENGVPFGFVGDLLGD